MPTKDEILDKIKHEETAIQKAVRAGDLPEVKRLVARRVDLKVRTAPFADSLLTLAATEGHLELCQYFIEMGFDVNDSGCQDFTAFHNASMRGHVEVMQLLLDHGATYQIDCEEHCPLNIAASHGRLAACKMLVGLGFNSTFVPQYADRHFKNAFEMALFGKHIDVVRYFVLDCGVPLTPAHIENCGGDFKTELHSLMTEVQVHDAMGDVSEDVPRRRTGTFDPL